MCQRLNENQVRTYQFMRNCYSGSTHGKVCKRWMTRAGGRFESGPLRVLTELGRFMFHKFCSSWQTPSTTTTGERSPSNNQLDCSHNWSHYVFQVFAGTCIVSLLVHATNRALKFSLQRNNFVKWELRDLFGACAFRSKTSWKNKNNWVSLDQKIKLFQFSFCSLIRLHASKTKPIPLPWGHCSLGTDWFTALLSQVEGLLPDTSRLVFTRFSNCKQVWRNLRLHHNWKESQAATANWPSSWIWEMEIQEIRSLQVQCKMNAWSQLEAASHFWQVSFTSNLGYALVGQVMTFQISFMNWAVKEGDNSSMELAVIWGNSDFGCSDFGCFFIKILAIHMYHLTSTTWELI